MTISFTRTFSCNTKLWHLRRPPHLTEYAATCGLSIHGACRWCVAMFWAHGAAPGLPPVPHVAPPRRTPPRMPSRRVRRSLVTASRHHRIVLVASHHQLLAPSHRRLLATTSHRHLLVAASHRRLRSCGIAPHTAGSGITPPATFTSHRHPPPRMEFAAATVVGFSSITPPSPCRRRSTPRSPLDVDRPITTPCPSSGFTPPPSSLRCWPPSRMESVAPPPPRIFTALIPIVGAASRSASSSTSGHSLNLTSLSQHKNTHATHTTQGRRTRLCRGCLPWHTHWLHFLLFCFTQIVMLTTL
jgi:hypothetical protein